MEAEGKADMDSEARTEAKVGVDDEDEMQY